MNVPVAYKSPFMPIRLPAATPSAARKHTKAIEIIGHGVSADGARFVELKLVGHDGPVTVLVRTVDLLRLRREEIGRLNRLGAYLISGAARRELIDRIQAARPSGPLFKVATRLGWADDEYVFPDEVISVGGPKVKTYLDGLPGDQIDGYHCGGTWDGAQQLFALARGNSRFQATAALALVGPIAPLINVPQVALQLTGSPDSGKTGLGAVVSSIWGRHPGMIRATQYGFGWAWNNTVNKLETLAAPHQHGFLFLDETRPVPQPCAHAVLDAAMNFEGGLSKGRLDGSMQHSWQLALFSTSNLCLDQLAANDWVDIDDAHRDRLIDIPPPENGFGFFEDLHGSATLAVFVQRLKTLSSQHYGIAIRRIIRELVKWLQRDPAGLRKWLQDRREYYLEKVCGITAPSRDLSRIHQKMATIYAAGCVGIRFGLFRWTRSELAKSLRSCTRGHIALVAAHLTEARGPATILRDYIRANEATFVDLRRRRAPAAASHALCPGYLTMGDGTGEYLLSNERFEAIYGSQAAAQRAKEELQQKGLLVTSSGGGNRRLVVKRRVGIGPDGIPVRAYVVAIPLRILQAG